MTRITEEKPPIVFVVDDDAAVRKSLARMIHSAGYAVEGFADPWELLQREHFPGNCCMVLDVRLPGMTGLELQEMLGTAGYDMAIIFITGYADVPSSVRAMKKGAVDFLVKPFRDRELLASIQQALAM